MTIVMNPKYESLRGWVESLPEQFATTGEVIYDARNQIRTYSKQGYALCVKRFHAPRCINRIVYTYLRSSKAQRSYENGMYMLAHEVGTPEPIAYILCYRHGLLEYSYLVTLQSRLTRLNREFTLAYTPELDQTIRPLARFTAHMHEQGILHLDFSPGNILWDKVDGDYQFELIDTNRMRVGHPVSLREGSYSMRRICARTAFFVTFAEEYAAARGMDSNEVRKWILYYRNRFWKNGKKAQYEYD